MSTDGEKWRFPSSNQDSTSLVQKAVLPGIFVGYALYSDRIWKGDIFVADVEELEILDSSEIHARRLNAHVSLVPKNGDEFIFLSQLE